MNENNNLFVRNGNFTGVLILIFTVDYQLNALYGVSLPC